MTSEGKISVFIPFLGNVGEIYETIQNCLSIEHIKNIIIYAFNSELGTYS